MKTSPSQLIPTAPRRVCSRSRSQVTSLDLVSLRCVPDGLWAGGGTGVPKGTSEVCEPWSDIKQCSDSTTEDVGSSCLESAEKQTSRKILENDNNEHTASNPHCCFLKPHFPDGKTEASRSQVTCLALLSSPEAGSSGLTPVLLPSCPQSG